MVKNYQSLRTQFKNKGYESIPNNDPEAWANFKDYHHIYNKLWIAESQDIPCGPMGIYPDKNGYPVIFKPIINLYGMSRGVRIINNDEEYDKNIRDGFFWEKYLSGKHRCIDAVIKEGDILFTSSWISIQGGQGTFDYHESDPNYELPDHIKGWIEIYLDEYTGCINFETINDNIIECHLRLNGDAHLYSDIFVDQLNNFLNNNIINFNYQIPKKYLIPLFVSKDFNKNIEKEQIIKLCAKYDVISIYFDDIYCINQSEHMSRLLLFDINDIEKGLELRNIIMKLINL